MIDSIINSLKDQVGDQLKNEANLDNSGMDTVMDVVKSVATEQVGKQLMGGGVDTLMNLFSDKDNKSEANDLQSSMTSGVMDGLTDKLGISSAQASSIANMVLPMLMKLITERNKDTPDDDASPLKDIFGGGGGGLDDLAGKALGGLFK